MNVGMTCKNIRSQYTIYHLNEKRGDNMESEEEVWKTLYYGDIRSDLYQISNMGRFRNKVTGHMMTPSPSEKGYMMVCFRLYGNKSRNIKIHRLVAKLFVRGETPEKCEVDHIDGDKRNNRASNLRWVSHLENIQYAYANNLIPIMYGERNGSCKVSENQVREICELLLKFDGKVAQVYKYLKLKGYDYKRDYILDIKRKRSWVRISDEYFKLEDFYNK